jgi:hypothetical protein
MTDDERAAVNEGLEQARRGAFVFDEQMRDLWRRLDVARTPLRRAGGDIDVLHIRHGARDAWEG